MKARTKAGAQWAAQVQAAVEAYEGPFSWRDICRVMGVKADGVGGMRVLRVLRKCELSCVGYRPVVGAGWAACQESIWTRVA